ncbi:MAG: VanZ family protein [Gammaproteobacteria bacterium]|nr:VanZ family protein [Gammaproteobacteria bacterium]
MDNKPTLIAIASIAALCLITLLTLTAYPKYKIIGPELLVNHDFSEQFTGWEKQGDPDNFRSTEDFIELSQDAAWQNTQLIQRLTPSGAPSSYLLSGELAVEGLIAGEKPWQRGGLLLLRLNENGERIASDDVTSLDGDLTWARHQAFIDIPPATAGVAVAARILEATGSLRIKSLSLLPAEQQAWFETIRYGFIVIWAMAIFALLWFIIRNHGVTTPLLVVLILAGLAFIGTLMPRDTVIGLDARITELLPNFLNDGLKQVLNSIFPGYIKHANQEISKLGHWLIFALLGLSSALYFRKYSLWICGFALLTMAATTETLQLLTDARSANIRDLLIDSAGILAGFLLATPLRLGGRQATTVN